ncbi:MAG: hypothetical protein KAH01_05660 [Caldisericia bacterium]|nr:hypothetical protein [Caldisericia bacterium]
MHVLGVSIWSWIFILWIATFLLTSIGRIFTGKMPEGIFWALFLITSGVMIIFHNINSSIDLGNTLGSVSLLIYVASVLILYGIRFLLKGWFGSAISIILILGFGFWIF